VTARLALLLVLGVVLPAWGQVPRRALGWEYERTFTPPVTGFVLTAVDGRGGVQQFQVALSEPGACDGVGSATDETFCTSVACPASGTITAYWVHAVSPTATSPLSNILTCWTPPNTSACLCLDPSQAPPGQALPPATPPALPAPPSELPPLSTEPPPLPQRSAEGLGLQPIGALPELSTIPQVPPSGGA
jgi:hypothetical protein